MDYSLKIKQKTSNHNLRKNMWEDVLRLYKLLERTHLSVADRDPRSFSPATESAALHQVELARRPYMK